MIEDIGRRGFFSESLKALARTLAETASAGKEFRGKPSFDQRRRIRPPGALEEMAFLQTCLADECNDCVTACPVDCIEKVPGGYGDTGTPVIIPALRACTMCVEVACSKVCEVGALTVVESPDQIDIGVAVLDESTCLAFNGTFCVSCFNICPTQPKAIRLDERGRPYVDEDPCTGCGLCEEHCPTTPKAIWVKSDRQGK
ncbi:MAG: 4Fe-4S ferredoxin [Planctomycetota bacterium]|nr:MAG: 4Fe-4S ferredoxin [Planctomycetota bacterium]